MSRTRNASLLAALTATCAFAQDDRVVLVGGTVVTECKVTSFDVRNLRYNKGSNSETVSTDRVVKVELGKFRDVFARGLKDGDVMLTLSREQLADKNTLLAQFGFVSAAQQFFDGDDAAKAVGALDEMQKSIPEAGLLPDSYRLKFEYYLGQGAKGAPSAVLVAKKYETEAISGAWPDGFAIEAEFFQALAGQHSPKDYQGKLRAIINKASGASPMIATRANVELAHSLRESKEPDNAQKLYEEVLKRDGGDVNSRAGALLGLGKILLDKAAPGDKDAFKKAMLTFLRVRLETRNAWPNVQADALYHAILAADKWRGPEYTLVMARCRRLLSDDYKGSEWEKKAFGR